MKNILIVLALICLLAAGCAPKTTINTEGNGNVDTTGDITVSPSEGSKITIDQAKKIAENSECTQKGSFTDKSFYNPNSKTWWIDLKMRPEFEKKICSPACVIFEETNTVEINWRCTGAIPPSEEKATCKDLCGDGTCQKIVCFAIGCPCAETEATCPEDCGSAYADYEKEAKAAGMEYARNIPEFKANSGSNLKIINIIAFKCPGCFQVDLEFDIGASKKGEVTIMTGATDLAGNNYAPKVASYEFSTLDIPDVTANECYYIYNL